MGQNTRDLIGGSECIVQIEVKFSRRKYHRGRRIDGHWLLGNIEDESEDFHFEICLDNLETAEILFPLILWFNVALKC